MPTNRPTRTHHVDRNRQPVLAISSEPQPRASRTLLVAVYLGAITMIMGRGGISVHRQTRGTLDRTAPIFGLSWLSSAQLC
jgi:hypothetical protein